MPTSSEVSPVSEPAGQSPQLPELVSVRQTIDGIDYPAAAEINSPDALEDWIALADDALTEARNGVAAISWPLALAGFAGSLALWADVFDGYSDLGAALSAHPWKAVVGAVLFLAAVMAFRLSDHITTSRKMLGAVRRAYLRRRRELAGQGSDARVAIARRVEQKGPSTSSQ